MEHKLPELRFTADQLAAKISGETLEYHHGKHHAAYVANLNKLIEGTEFADSSLADIVRGAKGGVFNNAAQHFNHSFYWDCITPGARQPAGALAAAIDQSFGSVDKLREEFQQKSATLFGSGWTWLVKNSDGSLSVEQYKDAGCPLTDGKSPLLTCDVWEHAYYIDYRNARPKYIEELWSLLNWDFAAANFEG